MVALASVTTPPPPPSWTRRGLLALGASLLAHGVTVASHRGEFWPFSIFPMFSIAGRPWTRAIVLDVTARGPASGFGPWGEPQLPGPPHPTRRLGISTNDLAKMVQLTATWTPTRLTTLRRLLQPGLEAGRTLLLTRADGDAQGILFTGLVRMTATTQSVNPRLSGGPT